MTRLLDTAPLPWHREHWLQILELFQSDTAGHAYIFSGEADTGKRYFARMLAEFILCRSPVAMAACGECPICLLNAAGSNPDLLLIAPEDGSKVIKVEQIRDIRQFLETRSHGFGKRIVILDTAESLGISSANALLKGLEEPPEDVIFLLITDRPKAVLPTISSRTQSVRLPRPARAEVLGWLLAQVHEPPAEELEIVIDLAQGRPFAARAIIESGSAAQLQEISEALLAIVQGKENPLAVASRFCKTQCAEMLSLMLYWLSELSKYRLTSAARELKGNSLKSAAQKLESASADAVAQTKRLVRLYDAVAIAQGQLFGSTNPNTQLMLEDLLLEMSHLFQRK